MARCYFKLGNKRLCIIRACFCLLSLNCRDEEQQEPAAPVKDAISKAMEKSQEADAAPAEEVTENGVSVDSPQQMEVEAM